MQATEKKIFKYTWEETIAILRNDPAHQDLIFNSYLSSDLIDNSHRFVTSAEFLQTLELLKKIVPDARQLLDMPGGNGIATHAFASAGFDVTVVEPNPSVEVGRGAIAHVLAASNLCANVIDAWGENLPFAPASFDVVYVRQGLHHAVNLKMMLTEIGRVLRPGGALLACREHVVDNYGSSLGAFLASQVDHQLYGGEHAFTLEDYRAAIDAGGLKLKIELGPFDSIINAYPNTPDVLRGKILQSKVGWVMCHLMSEDAVVAIGTWWLKRKKTPGRLYSFIATKPTAIRLC